MSETTSKYNYRLHKLKGIVVDNQFLNKSKQKKDPYKKTCLIVNPGIISKQLITKKLFQRKFSYNFWNNAIDAKLIKYLQKNKYDYVLIDEWNDEKVLNQFLNLVQFHEIPTKNILNIIGFYQKATGATPIIHINQYDNDYEHLIAKPSPSILVLKRIIDITVSIITIPIALPIVLTALVLTKLTSTGPCIFSQKRVGLYGKLFTIFKIRTMVHSNQSTSKHTIKNDTRITQLGKILRKTKIDELPQLWNVLKGEMSIIGPRPEKQDIVEQFNVKNIFYQFRHSVKPGITGWAQVNNPTATPEQNLEKLEYDLYYINNLSARLELKILLKTAGVITTMDSL